MKAYCEGNAEQAIACFETASDRSIIHINLGLTYANLLQDHEQAAQCFAKGAILGFIVIGLIAADQVSAREGFLLCDSMLLQWSKSVFTAQIRRRATKLQDCDQMLQRC